VEAIKRQTRIVYCCLVAGQNLWAQALPTACRLNSRSACDMNSAAAAAVCSLWCYTSVQCLCPLPMKPICCNSVMLQDYVSLQTVNGVHG